MQSSRCLEKILPLLKCVQCNGSVLQIVPITKGQWTGYTFNVGFVALRCADCGAEYPVTDDDIPILWTPMLEEMLRQNDDREDESQLVSAAGYGELLSNIKSYERISDDYAVNCRRDESLISRIRAGAVRLCTKEPGRKTESHKYYHLDVGCGPGHVLEWLKFLGHEQVGLDVSLANLRNARKTTNAFVVFGDGTAMPFKNDVFELVTGSAVLHHIYDWRLAIQESCRVCTKEGAGVMFDSEPTVDSLALSLLARLVFDMRWPVYKILSYIDQRKAHFRSIVLAREYYRTAEIHNQPGRGIPIRDVRKAFESAGFRADIYLSPNNNLQAREKISLQETGWKRIVLHLLSGHNPFLSKYGTFTVLAVSDR